MDGDPGTVISAYCVLRRAYCVGSGVLFLSSSLRNTHDALHPLYGKVDDVTQDPPDDEAYMRQCLDLARQGAGRWIASGRARPPWLGLDYGAVVRALYFLCRDGCINEKFMLEQPNPAEMFGPARPQGRPESEL